jgi:hypothetical protein
LKRCADSTERWQRVSRRSAINGLSLCPNYSSFRILSNTESSIWKPLRGPLNDWPLAVCDASSVDSAGDLEAADLLYPDLVTENYQVYYKSGYKWYYLSNHDVSEVIVFKQSDSNTGACPGMPPPTSRFSISQNINDIV